MKKHREREAVEVREESPREIMNKVREEGAQPGKNGWPPGEVRKSTEGFGKPITNVKGVVRKGLMAWSDRKVPQSRGQDSQVIGEYEVISNSFSLQWCF